MDPLDSGEKNYLVNQEELIRKEQAAKTNKFKVRVVESEINSNLFFQTLLYYNSLYSIICFCFQIISVSFKVWAFKLNNFSVTRLLLIIFWGIIEIYRLQLGYNANIEEFFPSLISFDLISVVFSVPPQVIMIVGPHVLPIDISTTIIYFVFLIFELITSIFTMRKIVKRKTALYYLRNTATVHTKPSHTRVKSSYEIAQEVEAALSDKASVITDKDRETNNKKESLLRRRKLS